MGNNKISSAWNEAAIDLGLTIIAPFALQLEVERLLFDALIPYFGSERGTLVGPFRTDDPRKRLGYFGSELHSSYETYDRQLFIDTLNDWGWFGPDDQRPTWYTGEPWTSPNP